MHWRMECCKLKIAGGSEALMGIDHYEHAAVLAIEAGQDPL